MNDALRRSEAHFRDYSGDLHGDLAQQPSPAALAWPSTPRMSFEKLRSHSADADGVHFTLRWRGTVVDCLVTCDALATYFGRDDEVGDGDLGRRCLRAYDASADTIRALARRLLDAAGQPPATALVMTTDDVFRALTEPAAEAAVVTGSQQ